MKNLDKKAFIVPVLVWWIAGALGVTLFVIKPKILDGDSKRAAKSTQTTQTLVAAVDLQGAFAAASIVSIMEANAVAPDSPSKAFIGQEGKVALASLPAPDQTALIEAERRKNAVLSGKLELSNQLYEQALHKADENAKATAKALAAKRASDLALEQEAAERLGAERLRNWGIVVGGLGLLLYLYVKFSHVSPAAMATIVTDLRAGAVPVQAVDASTSRLQQWMISFLAKLKAPSTP